MADRNDLPSPGANNFGQRVRETLMTYLGRQGDPLDRGVTLRDLIEAGVVKIRAGMRLGLGSGSLPIEPAINGGGTVTPEEPDLTPPPTPTGFAVTAALTNIFIEHDAPLYEQGHGHLRTRVYGKIVNTGDTLPTFADAEEIAQFTGTIHAHPTNPATAWRLWIKWETNDGVLSVAPAGGTNGLAAQTGLVGTSDLADAIVTAGKIASGAIDLGGSKVTGLLQNANMAVISDPTKIADYIISNTKLADLAITAGKIASGAVSLTKFASGIEPVSIVTGSLPSTKSTEAIVYNGKLYRWNGSSYTASVPTADLSGTVSDAQIAGMDAAKLSGQIGSTQIADNAISTPKLAAGSITAAKIAAGTIQASNIAAGTITGDLLAANTITGSKIAADTITAAQIAAGAISASELAAGAVTAGKIAANAIIANDGVIGNAAITNALIANAAVGAAQIADAAITSAKIGTAAIGAAAIQDGAITNAKIGTAAVDDAKVANLSASKLTAGSIAVGQYIQSASFVSGSTGWRINGNGSAEFSGVVVRGTIYASAGTIGGIIVDSGGISSSNYVPGSTGFSMNSNGDAQFNSVTLRGRISVPISGGNVMVGKDVGPYGGHHGISLSHENYYNCFIRRDDGAVYFVIGGGTNNYLSYNTDSGVLSLKGNLDAATGTFSGTLTASAIDAVNTVNIKGNAVTVPLTSEHFGTYTPSGGADQYIFNGTTGFSFSMPNAGKIVCMWQGEASSLRQGSILMYLNGTQIGKLRMGDAYQDGPIIIGFGDNAPAGNNIIKIRLVTDFLNWGSLFAQRLVVLGAQR